MSPFGALMMPTFTGRSTKEDRRRAGTRGEAHSGNGCFRRSTPNASASLRSLDVVEQLVGALETLLQYLRRPLLVIVVVIPRENDAGAAEGRGQCEDPHPHRVVQQVPADITKPPLVTPQMSRRCRTDSVGRKLVRPELSPHLSYLVARLLAFRIGGEHVSSRPSLNILSSSAVDSKERERREVGHVLAAQRRRGLEGVQPGLGRLVGGRASFTRVPRSARLRSRVV